MEVAPSIGPLERVYRLVVPRAVLEEVLKNVRSEYPIEACGTLFGRIEGGTAYVEKAAPLRNILASSSAFWFDVREWMEAIIRARGEGLEYIGIYHSHAREQPLPSLADRHRMMECPGEVWLIVAYTPGREPRLAAYMVDEHGLARVEVALV